MTFERHRPQHHAMGPVVDTSAATSDGDGTGGPVGEEGGADDGG